MKIQIEIKGKYAEKDIMKTLNLLGNEMQTGFTDMIPKMRDALNTTSKLNPMGIKMPVDIPTETIFNSFKHKDKYYITGVFPMGKISIKLLGNRITKNVEKFFNKYGKMKVKAKMIPDDVKIFDD